MNRREKRALKVAEEGSFTVNVDAELPSYDGKPVMHPDGTPATFKQLAVHALLNPGKQLSLNEKLLLGAVARELHNSSGKIVLSRKSSEVIMEAVGGVFHQPDVCLAVKLFLDSAAESATVESQEKK